METREQIIARMNLEPSDSNSDVSATECEDCGAIGPSCESIPIHDSPIGGFNLCPHCYAQYGPPIPMAPDKNLTPDLWY
jgi:hypothetical protein